MNLDQWKSHVDAFQNSTLSKREYARQHNLVYHKLLYYIQKFSTEEPMDFVPVAIHKDNGVPDPAALSAAEHRCLGILELPNGSRLHIHHPELLSYLFRFLTA